MSMPYVTELLSSEHTPEEIIKKIAAGLKISIKETLPVDFRCRCSREKVIDMLAGLAEKDLKDMANDEVSEVHCQFCNELYQFTSDEIREIKSKK